jgi:hypothetical protein
MAISALSGARSARTTQIWRKHLRHVQNHTTARRGKVPILEKLPLYLCASLTRFSVLSFMTSPSFLSSLLYHYGNATMEADKTPLYRNEGSAVSNAGNFLSDSRDLVSAG